MNLNITEQTKDKVDKIIGRESAVEQIAWTAVANLLLMLISVVLPFLAILSIPLAIFFVIGIARLSSTVDSYYPLSGDGR